jgi:hypothetical protein
MTHTAVLVNDPHSNHLQTSTLPPPNSSNPNPSQTKSNLPTKSSPMTQATQTIQLKSAVPSAVTSVSLECKVSWEPPPGSGVCSLRLLDALALAVCAFSPAGIRFITVPDVGILWAKSLQRLVDIFTFMFKNY